MSTTYVTSLSNVAEHIEKGVGLALENEIRRVLMLNAEKVVEEAAKTICKNLKTNTTLIRQMHDNSYEISLVIDGARHDVS